MRTIARLKSTKLFGRLCLGLTSLIVLASTLVWTAPLFIGQVGATTSSPLRVNLTRNIEYNFESPATLFQTCSAYYSMQTITASDVTYMRNAGYTGRGLDFLESLINARATIIRFKAASGAGQIINGGYNASGGAAACESVRLFPVSTTAWGGPEFRAFVTGATSGDVETFNMEFTRDATEPGAGPNTQGTIRYLDILQKCQLRYTQNSSTPPNGQALKNNCTLQRGFVVEGMPAFDRNWSNPVTFLNFSGNWTDASTITRTIPGQPSETYRMITWKGYPTLDNANNLSRNSSIYMLESARGERRELTWDTGRACDNPLEKVDGNGHPSSGCTPPAGGAHCVPFIAVEQPIFIGTLNSLPNIDGGTGSFKEFVNRLGASRATFYDYNRNCQYLGHSRPQNLGNQQNAKVWFYYSAKQKSIVNVFSSGLDNEQPYTGVYNQLEKNGNSATYRGGQTGCNADATVAHSNSATLLSTGWTFYRTRQDCSIVGNSIGAVAVFTLGGQAGEAGFTRVSSISPIPGTPAGEEPGIECAYDNPLSWIVCPFMSLAEEVITGFDGLINSMLTISTDKIFNDSTETGKAYRTAWGVFRTFALALIAIAALIMIIAQAAGIEVLDAYTLRKVLPALLLASVGITLSWEIMEFLVTLSNDLGNLIRSIIYSPFQSIIDIGQISGGAQFITLLFTGGALLAYGMLASASFLLTGLIASLIAVVMLLFREIVIIFCVITAPIGIACSILPNTKKGWSLWKSTFWGMLIVFMIISAFIALGRVFSATAAGGDFIQQVIAIIAWFAPYFLIPLAFRMAGGVVANVTGMLNDRSKGMFDRVRNMRSNASAKRGKRFMAGSLYRENRMSRPLNALGRRLGAAQNSGLTALMPTRSGRAARALHDAVVRGDAAKLNPALAELANDDDANAVLGLSGGSIAGMHEAARDLFTDENGNYDEERANRAMAAAQAVGVNRQNAHYALMSAMENKARAFHAGNVRALDRGVRRLAGNDSETYNSVAHAAAWMARSKGTRADLGGTQWISWDQNNAAWRQGAAIATTAGLTGQDAEMAQYESIADRNMVDGVRRTGVTGILGHDNQVSRLLSVLTRTLTSPTSSDQDRMYAAITLKELHGNMPQASGSVQELLNQTLFSNPGTVTNSAGRPIQTLGINENGNVAQQLADLTGVANFTGEAVTTMGRTYSEYNSQPGQAPQQPPPGPLPTTPAPPPGPPGGRPRGPTRPGGPTGPGRRPTGPRIRPRTPVGP